MHVRGTTRYIKRKATAACHDEEDSPMPFSLKFPWKIPPEDPVSGRLEPFYAAAKVQSRAACCSKKTTAVPLERSLFGQGYSLWDANHTNVFNTKQLFLDYALEVFCNRGRASIHQVIELGELSRDEQRSIVQRKEKFVPSRVWLWCARQGLS